GSTDWQLTRMRLDGSGYRSTVIEGYCSRQSVKAGEVLDVFVSTKPAAQFKFEIFRTGFYGGRGARKLAELGPFEGKEQPTPGIGEKRLRECQWEKCTSITIPADWVSGVYLGRLTTLPPTPDEPYWQSYVVFIVTDDRKADILLQCSDNTWQAYNKWPDDYSLYTDPKGNQGSTSDVSFDRPYAKYAQIYENPQSVGSGEWLCFEFPLAYWLEEQGYDVSYCSNADMITPDRGLKCKAFISVGHDEYWDIRQHDSVAKMRDEGVNLLFLSGNSVCWVTPFSPNASGVPNRRIFRGGPYGGDYTYAVDREKKYGPYPHRGPDEGYLMGVRNISPVNGGGDWTCVKPEHWIFEGTGMNTGDSIPGMIGWEYHGDPPKDLPGLEILAAGTAFQGGRNPQQWQAVIFDGPKGNFIFNASTIWWAQGMSKPPGHMPVWSHYSRPHGADKRVQRITANLLRKALQ
ncbi:MAG: N,N-dimethylformamidase beta subunit family domain-containing protein, partial [Prosthecobacter sp.]